MKKIILISLVAICTSCTAQSKKNSLLTPEMLSKLVEMPLHCINQEYPNKTGHAFNSEKELHLSPKDLHPVFYGCFDWHSSVHGHWMLMRVLNLYPKIKEKGKIIEVLNNSFQKEKVEKEARYFSDYELGKTFERTYGWAWVLKLDEELANSTLLEAKQWHKNLKPLTDTIVKLWKKYLPKQTYPNRTGVHPNSAFALGFAIDWAKKVGNKNFEKALIEKANYFYKHDKNTPAYLEPNGSDFFSPSLQIAYLMSRIYTPEEFEQWFSNFINEEGLKRVSEIPIVSDLNDYQTVHLVGLSFSRAWCMKGISQRLPKDNLLKKQLQETSNKLIENSLPLLFESNYGGGHWLASFAIYSLSK